MQICNKIIRPSKLQSSLDLIGPFLLFGFQEVKRLTNHQPTTKHTTNKPRKNGPQHFFRDFEVKKPMDLQVSMLYNCCWECIRNHCCDIGRPRHAPGPRRNNLSLDRLMQQSHPGFKAFWGDCILLEIKDVESCFLDSTTFKSWIYCKLLFKVYIFLKAFGGNQ